MFIPEEETVSSALEQGTFYTPASQSEFSETPLIFKATLLIAISAALSIVLPALLPNLTLTQALASILLTFGFLMLTGEGLWPKIGVGLSVLYVVYGCYRYVMMNIIPHTQLPGTFVYWILLAAAATRVGIFLCIWMSVKQLRQASGKFALISLFSYCGLLILTIPTQTQFLSVAQICAGLVCVASLVATTISTRK